MSRGSIILELGTTQACKDASLVPTPIVHEAEDEDDFRKGDRGAAITLIGQPQTPPLVMPVRPTTHSRGYVIYPATGEIGIPPSPSKFILLPLFAYSRDTCPRTADMRGAKVEVDPQLVVDKSRLEFTSFSGVRVSW